VSTPITRALAPCTPNPPLRLLQGIVGTTPWLALVFLTLWFQLLGMSDLQASLLLATFLAAMGLGESCKLLMPWTRLPDTARQMHAAAMHRAVPCCGVLRAHALLKGRAATPCPASKLDNLTHPLVQVG